MDLYEYHAIISIYGQANWLSEKNNFAMNWSEIQNNNNTRIICAWSHFQFGSFPQDPYLIKKNEINFVCKRVSSFRQNDRGWDDARKQFQFHFPFSGINLWKRNIRFPHCIINHMPVFVIFFSDFHLPSGKKSTIKSGNCAILALVNKTVIHQITNKFSWNVECTFTWF